MSRTSTRFKTPKPYTGWGCILTRSFFHECKDHLLLQGHYIVCQFASWRIMGHWSWNMMRMTGMRHSSSTFADKLIPGPKRRAWIFKCTSWSFKSIQLGGERLKMESCHLLCSTTSAFCVGAWPKGIQRTIKRQRCSSRCRSVREGKNVCCSILNSQSK